MIVHADDFGITVSQARAVLDLSSACDGQGALNSVSIFANSPAFEESAALARRYALETAGGGNRESAAKLSVALHLNLVEGPSCADPASIPLLVDEKGMFRNDFARLLLLEASPEHDALNAQIKRECTAQLERFFDQFPGARSHLRIDSHQHVHAIPAIFETMLEAIEEQGAALTRLRQPSEPLGPHLRCGTLRYSGLANRAKAALLTKLCRHNRGRVPTGCATPVFCGVILSGKMSRADAKLARAFEEEAACLAAARADRSNYQLMPGDEQVETLFHPVSVPVEQCLDPSNTPFATACASPERDAEAEAIRRLPTELGA